MELPRREDRRTHKRLINDKLIQNVLINKTWINKQLNDIFSSRTSSNSTIHYSTSSKFSVVINEDLAPCSIVFVCNSEVAACNLNVNRSIYDNLLLFVCEMVFGCLF